MGSVLRDKLYNNWVDQGRKNYVMQEYQHFASIAPKRLFKSFITRRREMLERQGLDPDDPNARATPQLISGKNAKIAAVVIVILLLPLIAFIGPYLGMIAFVIFIVFLFKYMSSRTPEYKQYDFKTRIVQPTLQTIDEKLFLNFWDDPRDLVDNQVNYDNALVEAHLIIPTKGRCSSYTYSCCTYDWMNKANPDAFEFMGYKVYYEWKDSDNETHETTYFDGLVFKFRMEHSFRGSINIMSTHTKETLLGGEKEKNQFKHVKSNDIIDTESVEFASNFDTVATYGEEAFYYLTPVMIERLLELKKLHNFCICIKGDVMTVTLQNGHYKNVSSSTFSRSKPHFAPEYPEKDIASMISAYQKAIMSILELKDIVAPRRFDS